MNKKFNIETEKYGAIFKAIPNDGMVKFVPTKGGTILPLYTNNIVIPDDLFEPIKRRYATIWHPSLVRLPLNEIDALINTCADADEYQNALKWLDEISSTNQIRVFNHPSQIMLTRRDQIASILENTPFLTVPKCVQFLARKPDECKKTFESNSFKFPVLIRPAASQGGKYLIKIDNESEWEKIYEIPWNNQPLYMTQFVDFLGKNSLYAKLRITVVGNYYTPRHVKFDDNWNVHHSDKTSKMIEEEMAIIDQVKNSERFQSMMATILGRIKLDFWGIDLGYINESEDFVLFEGNAAMSMLFSQQSASSPRYLTNSPLARRRSEIHSDLKHKLKVVLEDPNKWVYRDHLNNNQNSIEKID